MAQQIQPEQRTYEYNDHDNTIVLNPGNIIVAKCVDSIWIPSFSAPIPFDVSDRIRTVVDMTKKTDGEVVIMYLNRVQPGF
jgi:nucleosome binding factor SPN SPT16 subunit